MKFSFWVLISSVSSFLVATPFQLSSGKVEFLALATPGALKIAGKQSNSNALKTEIKVEGVQVTGSSAIQIDSFSTGIGLRDRHMKENYLEASKFPESSFTYKKLTLPSSFSGEKIPFEGLLKLHGVEKPVSGFVTAEKKESQLTLKHEFKIKTSDFGISTPKYMGVVMAEDVEVRVILEGTL